MRIVVPTLQRRRDGALVTPQRPVRALTFARSTVDIAHSRRDRRRHHSFRVGLVVAEHGADAPLAHDDDAVAHRQHLGEVRGDDHHGDAVTSEIVDELVDVGLGTDVDAPRRFVEDRGRAAQR